MNREMAITMFQTVSVTLKQSSIERAHVCVFWINGPHRWTSVMRFRKHSNITAIKALHRPVLHSHIKQAQLNVGERAFSLARAEQRKEREGEGNLWHSDEKQEGKILVILVLTEDNLTGLSAQGESRHMARVCSDKGNHSFRNPHTKKKKCKEKCHIVNVKLLFIWGTNPDRTRKKILRHPKACRLKPTLGLRKRNESRIAFCFNSNVIDQTYALSVTDRDTAIKDVYLCSS